MSGTNGESPLGQMGPVPGTNRDRPAVSACLHSKFAILSHLSLGWVGFVPGGASENFNVVCVSWLFRSQGDAGYRMSSKFAPSPLSLLESRCWPTSRAHSNEEVEMVDVGPIPWELRKLSSSGCRAECTVSWQ